MRSALSRLLIGVSAAALLSSAALPAMAIQEPAAAAASAEAPGWPQATSDIPADANVRFGRLPNGMRYAIMANDTPPQQAALRLNIDAGSLSETRTSWVWLTSSSTWPSMARPTSPKAR